MTVEGEVPTEPVSRLHSPRFLVLGAIFAVGVGLAVYFIVFT